MFWVILQPMYQVSAQIGKETVVELKVIVNMNTVIDRVCIGPVEGIVDYKVVVESYVVTSM